MPNRFGLRTKHLDGFTIAVPELKGMRISSKDSLHIGFIAKYFDYITAYNDRLELINHLAASNLSTCNSFIKEIGVIKNVMKLFPIVQQL